MNNLTQCFRKFGGVANPFSTKTQSYAPTYIGTFLTAPKMVLIYEICVIIFAILIDI